MNRKYLRLFLFALAGFLAGAAMNARGAGVRIKDIAMIAGARDNQLSGLGLVVGLAGDGDKNPPYTVQAVANMLQSQGITVPPATVQSKNGETIA